MASSLSAKDYNIGILDVKKPQDHSCQELLTMSSVAINGWLRKRSLRNKIITMSWPREYVVVSNQCLYYFTSETAKKPSGSHSFYGFNRICRAPRLKAKDTVWAFKIEHIQPSIRSLYFSASSEKEMVQWMRVIKQEMLLANGKDASKTTGSAEDSQYGESIASEDSWGSCDYNFLESSIYEEPVMRPMSFLKGDGDDDSDFEDGEDIKFEPQVKPSAPEVSEYDLGCSMEKEVSLPGPSNKKNYWASVRFDGSKVEASKIISSLGEDGVYLVRKSEDNSNVLVVHSGQVKKYKIVEQVNGKVTLSSKTEPEFDNMEDMLYHYYSNNLPSSDQKLTCPFLLHADYHNYQGM